MYPLSDKELDRLSREAAEQYDVESSTSGWEQVENKLNKVMPTQKEKDRRRFAWLFFLLFLVGGAGLTALLLRGDNKELSAITDKKELNKEKENAEVANEQGSVKPGTELDKISEKNPASTGTNISEAENRRGTDKEYITEELTAKKIQTEESFVLNRSIKGSKTIRHNTAIQKNNGLGNNHKGTENYSTDPLQPAHSNSLEETKEISTETELDPEKVPEPSLVHNYATPDLRPNVKPSVTPDLAAAIRSIIASNTTTANAGKNKYKAPLAFGIVLGSDQSNIHGTTPGSFGWSTGLTVQYDLTKRLSVNTGFTITKKFYEAQSKDFHPPKHYWTSYVNLQSVIGDCQMWEIPVQLRYDLSVMKSTRLFINSGVSNYIMRKQSYQYHYLNSSNVMAVRNWETNSQSNYWLGILNVSAGIEKNLNRSFSFQLEPYIKLPLKGVGFGNMDISSYGLLLSMRYRPFFRNR